jgi:hypothetical protein
MATEAINNLMRNRDAIRRIMAMDANGKMDRMLENAVQNGRVSYSENGVSYKTTQSQNDGRVVVNEEVMKRSKMPKKILESFQQNPGTSTQMPTSVLDGLGLESLQEMRNEPTVKEQQIQYTGGSNIDYSLLRTIINEAVQENVKKYMSALSKKLLSEGVTINSNSGDTIQAIKLGKRLSIITSDGTIYEAEMKKKCNINEQKK